MRELIARIAECGHSVHNSCLTPWLDRANSCPICRVDFNEVELTAYVGGPVISTYPVKSRKQRVADTYLATNDFLEDAMSETDLFFEAVQCPICYLNDNIHAIVLCDCCAVPYHTYCIGLQEIPGGPWFCEVCAADRAILECLNDRPALADPSLHMHMRAARTRISRAILDARRIEAPHMRDRFAAATHTSRDGEAYDSDDSEFVEATRHRSTTLWRSLFSRLHAGVPRVPRLHLSWTGRWWRSGHRRDEEMAEVDAQGPVTMLDRDGAIRRAVDEVVRGRIARAVEVIAREEGIVLFPEQAPGRITEEDGRVEPVASNEGVASSAGGTPSNQPSSVDEDTALARSFYTAELQRARASRADQLQRFRLFSSHDPNDVYRTTQRALARAAASATIEVQSRSRPRALSVPRHQLDQDVLVRTADVPWPIRERPRPRFEYTVPEPLPLPEPETADEALAWSAFERAREEESQGQGQRAEERDGQRHAQRTPAATGDERSRSRKRRDRGSLDLQGESSEQRQEDREDGQDAVANEAQPTRRFKRPRTRRARAEALGGVADSASSAASPFMSDAASVSHGPQHGSAISSDGNGPTSGAIASTSAQAAGEEPRPSFLQSLLQEVEHRSSPSQLPQSQAQSSNGSAQTTTLTPSFSGFSMHGSQPLSPPMSPRLLDIPQGSAARATSPASSAGNARASSPASAATPPNSAGCRSPESPALASRPTNSPGMPEPTFSPSSGQQQHRRQAQGPGSPTPRSGTRHSSHRHDHHGHYRHRQHSRHPPGSPSLSLAAKSILQSYVGAALKPFHRRQVISTQEYTDINRRISRSLYERVGSDEGRFIREVEDDNDKQRWWESVARQEVEGEVVRVRGRRVPVFPVPGEEGEERG
ncbi:hypothetical protein KEM55_000004 [Ascosphaera atra]|nr:hypothetical protein KEM55_000004 [Ascosphaera atra]